jgi:hypothetical protein
MKRMMNRLILSCKRATELIEKKFEVRLNTRKNVQLYMHTRLCTACNTYQKQSKQLDNALHLEARLSNAHDKPPIMRQLAPQTKARIVKKLLEE